MGLAVYNSIILDLHFPTACYKKLLSPPVIPQNLNHANVGVWKFGIDDLAEVMPVSLSKIQYAYRKRFEFGCIRFTGTKSL